MTSKAEFFFRRPEEASRRADAFVVLSPLRPLLCVDGFVVLSPLRPLLCVDGPLSPGRLSPRLCQPRASIS